MVIRKFNKNDLKFLNPCEKCGLNCPSCKKFCFDCKKLSSCSSTCVERDAYIRISFLLFNRNKIKNTVSFNSVNDYETSHF